VFSKNRDRLLEGDIAAKFLAAVLAQPKVKTQCRSEFPWPETLERHSCFEHRSRCQRKSKGKETKLCFIGQG